MTARIYCGTYAKYNDGSIKGEWFDLEDYCSKEEFIDACLELHDDEEDPELMFQDWEDIPDKYISESWIDADFWGEYLNLDDDDKELLSAYQDGVDSTGTIEQAREAYCGKADNKAEFAEEFHRECGYEIPDWLEGHIDWDSVARDMGYGDFSFVEFNGDTWVFRS